MAIRKFKPTSPGRRFGSVLDFRASITKPRPEKSLLARKNSSGGRNNLGRVTCRHRGGGHRQHYRIIDFKREKDGVPGAVVGIEYDPNRSANIALIQYRDGEKRYILAPDGLRPGDQVMSGPAAEPRVGNAIPMSDIPVGMEIHAIELRPGQGARLVRSAGNVGRLMAKEGGHAVVVLPSGEMRKVPLACRATIGQVGNSDHQNVSIGKAGRRRWMGIRPTTRGAAQNPVSHPMGGGEGRAGGGGRDPVSKWGKLAKGGKTRKRNHPSNKWILRRRKK